MPILQKNTTGLETTVTSSTYCYASEQSLSALDSHEESEQLSTYNTPASFVDIVSMSSVVTKDRVSETDKDRIRSFNATPLLKCVKCIHEMFRETATRLAASEAICAWDASLTYHELDEQSDLMAYKLREMGVMPESYIPIMMEKSSLLPIAILGVLKSGAAYVPLSPGTPIGRLKSIVERSKARIVISCKAHAQMVRRVVKAVFVLSARLSGYVTPKIRQAMPLVDPEYPAACVFTSGSTGQPKGIVIQHQAQATWLQGYNARNAVVGERIFQFSASAFDVFTADICIALVLGGCLCIPSEDDRRTNLVGSFNRLRATMFASTPACMALIKPDDVPGLEKIMTGGETPRQDVLNAWIADSRRTVIAAYGPAEACPVSTSTVCKIKSFSPSHIGKPLPSHCGFIVRPEDHERLVPIGMVGELVIGGLCLAKEYIDDKEKTQASFIEGPGWASDLGLSERRFYKTGDLVKYDEDAMDGSFLFVGRKDAQVKLRGQRIELAEIEHHLLKIAGVACALAAVPKSGLHRDQLVAVVGLNNAKSAQSDLQIVQGTKLTSAFMRDQLSPFLPEYMVPVHLYVVKALPISLSTKLDRKAVDNWLSGLEAGDSLPSSNERASRLLDSDEKTALSIAEEIAHRCSGRGPKFQKMLERHDFVVQDAGLDSVQLMALSMFLQKEFGARVPASLLFDSALTVRALAKQVDSPNTVIAANCHNTGMYEEVDEVIASQLTRSETRKLAMAKRRKVTPSLRVLVTGATGYLGNEILRLLLRNPSIKVKALVRAPSNFSGLARLIGKAKNTGWWQDRLESRLDIWLGDLSAVNLGLRKDHLQQLMGRCNVKERIDVIIHNGAVVHYGQDYAKLKSANVLSTATLLKAVAANRQQNHEQTLVYVSGGQELSFEDDDDIQNVAAARHGTGYSQTKLVSELMVKRFSKTYFQDCQMAVIKPGYIVGTSDGRVKPQTTDFIWRLIASCVSIEAICEEDLEKWIPISDAESVAKVVVSPVSDLVNAHSHEAASAVIKTRSKLQQTSSVRKVMTGIRWRLIVDMLQHKLRFRLDALPKKAWTSRLRNDVSQTGEQHPLFPLIHQFDDTFQLSRQVPTSAEYDDLSVLDMIKVNVEHLVAIGYISRPQYSLVNHCQ